MGEGKEAVLRTLRALWHRWERITARVDNPAGRTILTVLLVVLLWQLPRGWKLFLPLYMLTLGKFVFAIVLPRVVLTLVYAVMILPMGLFVRMSDPLRVRQREADTHWISRELPDETLDGARKQG